MRLGEGRVAHHAGNDPPFGVHLGHRLAPLVAEPDRAAVGGDAAVLQARNFRGKERHHTTFDVVARQRLIGDAASGLIFDPWGQMRIESLRRLPVEESENGGVALQSRGGYPAGEGAGDPCRSDNA